MKESFLLYKSFYEPIKQLSDEQLGRLMRALFAYQIDGSEPEACEDIFMAFAFFKNQFRLDDEKYERLSERRSESGKKGGRPKKGTEEEKAKKANAFTESKKTLNDNENDKDNVNVLKETSSSDDDEGKKGENPPSPPFDDPITDPPQSNAQKAPPPTPSPSGEMPVEQAAELALKEQIWVESIQMKHRMSMGELKQNIKDFIPHCCARGKEKDSLMGFKQHFDSWLDKKRQFAGNTQNGVQKGKYEKLMETRNEALKMLGIDDG